ncbi:MAG: hypothetical protein HQK59_03430 [Deltaproteobacteria bacterium]|nr:hypothetical protein [Deltaproteobacteria bacterium]
MSGHSEPIRQAVKEGRIQGQHSVNTWLSLLGELDRYKVERDSLRHRCSKLAGRALFVLSLMGTATYLIWLFSQHRHIHPAILVAAYALDLVLAGMIIFGTVGYIWLRGKVVINDFSLLLIPALKMIKDDLKPGSLIKLKLDLRGPVKEKILRERKLPPGDYVKLTETIYSDRWLEMEAVLVKGHRLIFRITNKYLKYKSTRRNPRGKFKFKTKWKKIVTVTGSIRPNAQRLQIDPVKLQDSKISGKTKFKSKKGGSCRLSRKYKFKPNAIADSMTVTPKELIGLSLNLCSFLSPSAPGK